MSQVALVLSLSVPWLLAAALAAPSTARAALRLAPWAALPALAAALLAQDFQLDIPWLLIGARIGLNETARLFLLFTAGLWLAAGWYAGAYHARDSARRRYFIFHLLTLGANLGLVVAQDAASFYLFFVVMSFAAYGMIVHAGSDEAIRAGRVYIIMVIIGEALILPGLWSAVAVAPTLSLADVAAGALQAGPLTTALLVLGFGVKAGLVPLHLWLPLAHPAAPTPASAVLSGAMIKAGVLAWITLLPLGASVFSGLGAFFIAAGFVNAFFGVAVGLCQPRPKTVLAYSSISQIGLIMVAIGLALAGGEAVAAAVFAVGLYCLHHATAKGALFLGVGIVEHSTGRQHRLALAALTIPALALAGAPLTTGFGAKLTLKEAAYALPDYGETVELLLGVAAVGTTLLMVRFLVLMARSRNGTNDAGRGMWIPWLGLIGAGLLLAWLPDAPAAAWADAADRAALWSALWPILCGAALAVLGGFLWRRGWRLPRIPEGDLVVPAGRLAAASGLAIAAFQRRQAAWANKRAAATAPLLRRGRRRLVVDASRLEAALCRGPVVALNLVAVIALLLAGFLLS